jgi:hypothetical protein
MEVCDINKVPLTPVIHLAMDIKEMRKTVKFIGLLSLFLAVEIS